MLKPLALSLLFLAAVPAFAAAPDHWVQVHTEHFTVICNGTDKDARRTAAQFERMRAVFHKLIPTAAADEGAQITVLGLKDKKSFDSLEPAPYLAKGALPLDGLFLRTPDRNYILVRLDTSSSSEHPYATVYHEYTHMLNSKAEWLPLWLNEGLAEFYQNTDIEDKDVRLGQPSRDDILFLRQNKLIPLETLFTVDHNSPYYHEENKGSIFYAESWAITHYLTITDQTKGTHHIHEYLMALNAGQDPLTAAQHAFGDLKQLQKALDQYVQQGSFSFFKLPVAFPVDPNSFTVQPLSDSDASSIRADVLVYTDRKPEALELLKATLAADPKNALAHETMGYLAFRDGDITAARKWYDEAVQLDSRSFLAQYYSAVLALQTGSDSPAIESSLRTSIQLNPKFAPSYDALAHVLAMRRGDLDEAHHMNAMAIDLEPTNVSYRINAASVLMQKQDFTNALNVLKTAERIAQTPSDQAIVRARIEQVEQFQSGMQGPRSSATLVIPQQPTADSPDSVQIGAQPGDTAATDAEPPHFPITPATGPHHTIRGVVHNVKCYYPTVLALTVDSAPNKSVPLYTNNYYKVDYFTLNYQPPKDTNPCKDMEGMKANVIYAELPPAAPGTNTAPAAGQILRIELSK